MSDREEVILNNFDPEIERTFLRLRRVKQATRVAVMGDNQRVLLRDLWIPRDQGFASGIISPVIQSNNFEWKPALINMVQHSQFSGSALEDPHEHIRTFLE